MIPCVIYAAKSTKDINASIPEQLADCREMAAENGWEIIGEFWTRTSPPTPGTAGRTWRTRSRSPRNARLQSGT